MSEKIFYETTPNGLVCLTDCPYGKMHNVGSGPCHDCEHFVSDNLVTFTFEDEQYVECDFEE